MGVFRLLLTQQQQSHHPLLWLGQTAQDMEPDPLQADDEPQQPRVT